jgi:hypothetical protein
MYEIATMNPRPAKRKGKKRRKARKSNPGAKTVKRNSKGRFVKRASNPRRRKRRHNARRAKRSKIRVRKTAHKVVVSNPRRRKRRRHSNPRHHMRKRRHRRSNPISLGGLTSGLVPALTDGAIGGAGALANSVLLGYLSPMLPASFTSGYAYDAVRIGSAVALWMAGKKFGGRKGDIAGQGAIAVAMYFLLRDITTAMAPTLPLGDYEEVAIDNTADQIGAYMDPARPLGAYLPDGSRARGVGAYMRGMEPDANYGESSDGFVLAGTDY